MFLLAGVAGINLHFSIPTSFSYTVSGKCWYKDAPYSASYKAEHKYSGDKFYYAFHMYDASSIEVRFTEGAFDGERSYYVRHNKSRLDIKTGNSLNQFDNFDTNPLYYLYSGFITRNSVPDAQVTFDSNYALIPISFPKINQIINSKQFDNAFKLLKNQNDSGLITLIGDSVMDTMLGTDSNSASVEIQIDANRGFSPVKWIKKCDENLAKGRTIEFEVTDWTKISNQSGAFFYYPKISKVTYYYNGVAYQGQTMVIEEFKINPEFNESDFQIDPASVSQIFDQDTRTLIEVPH